MPREFAKTNLEMWSDPDFRALPPAAQHLYLVLWTSPDLSYCGVHDWRPGRLAARSAGFTGEHIQRVADSLIARHFLVADYETEEILVRSWARWDGLLKQPRMAVSYATAYAVVASSTLRAVLVHETQKMHKRHPGLACWKDPRVAGILEHPEVSAKDLPTPDDPFGDDFGGGFGLGLPQTRDGVWGSVCTPPTTATATATNNRSTAPSDKSDTTDDRFDEFWDTYGHKVDRKGAEQKWRLALKKPGVTADLLIAAAAAYVTHERQNNEGGRFIMGPTKWLLNERWTDQPTNVRRLPAADPDAWMRRRPNQ